MAIEWPTDPRESTMTVDVPDNWPAFPGGPNTILVANQPCNVNISWAVPPPHNMMLGGSFRLRAYIESLGPGQEIQIGQVTVAVVGGQINYTTAINVPGSTILGEGEAFVVTPGAPPVPVSGVYKIVAVLQHMNPGTTQISGYAEEIVRMFRTP